MTAVGDPHQSIYGWRGASATTLHPLPRGVRRRRRAGRLSCRCPRAGATTRRSSAWPTTCRAAARRRPGCAVAAAAARARRRPGAGQAARLLTVEDEAAHVADWIGSAGWRAAGATPRPPCCAASAPSSPRHRRPRGSAASPYEVVGLGGLLATPEVADIVALLHVVQDPTRGDQLMRLLTGPLCRLGAADLDGLVAWARHLQRCAAAWRRPAALARRWGRGAPGPPRRRCRRGRRDASAHAGPPCATRRRTPSTSPASSRRSTTCRRPGWRSRRASACQPCALAAAAGLRRGRAPAALADRPAAGRPGRRGRARARPRHRGPGPARATPRPRRAPTSTPSPTSRPASPPAPTGPPWAGSWPGSTPRVDEERGLDQGYIEASPDAVQVLTVHAAKGLEWDVVAVPGLVEGSFPALGSSAGTSLKDGTGGCVRRPKDKGWCGGLSGVPYDLRGDRDGLPVWAWRQRRGLGRLEAETERVHPGRRRARHRRGAPAGLRRLHPGPHRPAADRARLGAAAARPAVTSRFLTEVLERAWAWPSSRPRPGPDMAPTRTNPSPAEPAATADDRSAVAVAAARASAVETCWPSAAGGRGSRRRRRRRRWPRPPWRRRRRQCSRCRGEDLAACSRRSTAAARRAGRPAAAPGRRGRRCPGTCPPRRWSPWPRTPSAFALELRRPMPQPPALAARRGTAFHAWVEQHYAQAAMVDLLDLPGSADEDPGDDADLPADEGALPRQRVGRPHAGRGSRPRRDGRRRHRRPRPDRRGLPPRRVAGSPSSTGRPGPGRAGSMARARALQLAAYRLAFARLRGARVAERRRGVLLRRQRRDRVARAARRGGAGRGARRRSRTERPRPAVGAAGRAGRAGPRSGGRTGLDSDRARRRPGCFDGRSGAGRRRVGRAVRPCAGLVGPGCRLRGVGTRSRASAAVARARLGLSASARRACGSSSVRPSASAWPPPWPRRLARRPASGAVLANIGATSSSSSSAPSRRRHQHGPA